LFSGICYYSICQVDTISFLPSLPSALQLRASFGLLNNLPLFFINWVPCIYFILEADYLVSQQFNFYGVRLLASRLTPNLEDQGIPLCLVRPLNLSGMGDPTNSYATAGIALRVSGALKPHGHVKVETPSMGVSTLKQLKNNMPVSESKILKIGNALVWHKL
jgi:hypothetical protein